MSKFCFAAAALTVFVLLPVQAQAPKQDGKPEAETKAASELKYSIGGAVSRPGIYRFKPGYLLSDALSDAAGPVRQANLSVIMLTHTDKGQNTSRKVWVNFNDFILHGQPSGNPPLQPGDNIYILSKKRSHTLIASGLPQTHLVY